MFFDNLEFHNIRELADLDGYGGKVLLRMPQALFPNLKEHTVLQYHSVAVSEIRFKAECLPVEPDIPVYEKEAYTAVYFGDHAWLQLNPCSTSLLQSSSLPH